jgi:hypothetical protein
MMTRKPPLLTKVSYGVSIALLALAFTSGVSVVRAESDAAAPTWREMLLDPVLDAVKAVEDRLGDLEGKVALFRWSFTSRQITTHELCIADDHGAHTCISKAQLDGLLKMMQAAALAQPATVTDCAVEPKAVAEPADVAPAAPATETSRSDTPETKVTVATIGARGPAATAAQAAPEEDAPDQDARSVPPSSASPSHGLLAYPDEEIVLWAD